MEVAFLPPAVCAPAPTCLPSLLPDGQVPITDLYAIARAEGVASPGLLFAMASTHARLHVRGGGEAVGLRFDVPLRGFARWAHLVTAVVGHGLHVSAAGVADVATAAEAAFVHVYGPYGCVPSLGPYLHASLRLHGAITNSSSGGTQWLCPGVWPTGGPTSGSLAMDSGSARLEAVVNLWQSLILRVAAAQSGASGDGSGICGGVEAVTSATCDLATAVQQVLAVAGDSSADIADPTAPLSSLLHHAGFVSPSPSASPGQGDSSLGLASHVEPLALNALHVSFAMVEACSSAEAAALADYTHVLGSQLAPATAATTALFSAVTSQLEVLSSGCASVARAHILDCAVSACGSGTSGLARYLLSLCPVADPGANPQLFSRVCAVLAGDVQDALLVPRVQSLVGLASTLPALQLHHVRWEAHGALAVAAGAHTLQALQAPGAGAGAGSSGGRAEAGAVFAALSASVSGWLLARQVPAEVVAPDVLDVLRRTVHACVPLYVPLSGAILAVVEAWVGDVCAALPRDVGACAAVEPSAVAVIVAAAACARQLHASLAALDAHFTSTSSCPVSASTRDQQQQQQAALGGPLTSIATRSVLKALLAFVECLGSSWDTGAVFAPLTRAVQLAAAFHAAVHGVQAASVAGAGAGATGPSEALRRLLAQRKDTLWRHGGHPTLPPQAALQLALHRLEALSEGVALDASPAGLAHTAHRIGVLSDRAAMEDEGGAVNDGSGPAVAGVHCVSCRSGDVIA